MVQVIDHLQELSKDQGRACLATWPASGPSVEKVFTNLFAFMDSQASRLLQNSKGLMLS